MTRRYRERRYRRRRRDTYNRRINLTSLFRRPRTQMIVLAVVTLIIIILLLVANQSNKSRTPAGLLPESNTSMAYSGYQGIAVQNIQATRGEMSFMLKPDPA